MRGGSMAMGLAVLALIAAAACGGGEDPPDDGDSASGGQPSNDGSGGQEQDGEGGDSASGGTSSSNDGDAGSGTDSGGDGDSGGTGGGTGGSTTPGCTLVWSSGFENGFPGTEWLNYDDGSYSPDGNVPAGRSDAWTIIDRDSGEPVYSGDHAYKGWIVGDNGAQPHRSYPVIHTDLETPVVNTYMVYLDMDYDLLGADWVHVGTWGNEENGEGSWALHTMSIRDRELEFAHTTPNLGEYIGPSPEPEYPLGRWVRFTVYISYEGSTGFVQAWQDGVPMLRGEVSDLAEDPGTRMTRAHWGMYAPGSVTDGIQYNDDIALWTLDGPLSDLESEPDCYLDQ